jgi:subtilisin family serine protease
MMKLGHGLRLKKIAQVKTLILFLALGLSACSQGSSSYPLQDPPGGNDQLACPNALIKNRYIVQWNDGRYTIVNAENEESFKRNFIDPQLDKIKHIDRDMRIQVNPVVSSGDFESFASNNWGPQKIQADQVWNEGFQGNGVIVGVVDGMVDKNHVQLKNNVASTQQFNQETNNPSKNIHGTHVAGIIAADPTLGPVSGIAPKAKIVGGQFIGNNGGGSLGDAILALNSVASRGAKIINMSWGGAGCAQNLSDALKSLSDRGILLVTAAGNEGSNSDISPTFPAGYGFARQINVAATDSFDMMALFSTRGSRTVNIAAPGVGIVSTIPSNQYQSMDGTSMAAPMVSGAAALLWGAVPSATVDQIKNALLKAVDLSPGNEYQVSSKGRLNVKKALDELRQLAQ